MAQKIPGGIKLKDFDKISEYLRNIRGELNAVWVSCRLNETGEKDPSPFFVGWVEDDQAERARIGRNDPDPGLYRFGDDYYSEIYEECLKNPDRVIAIDEKAQKIVGKTDQMQWLAGAEFLSVKSGANHRRSIAIKINRRSVGTLNAGFINDPGNTVDKKMKDLAQPPDPDQSALTKYLKDNFDLGGPTGS